MYTQYTYIVGKYENSKTDFYYLFLKLVHVNWIVSDKKVKNVDI